MVEIKSEELYQKWKSLMERKYGYTNPTREEVFEFVTDLTKFFEVILEDGQIFKNHQK